jgi:hypothetical protein
MLILLVPFQAQAVQSVERFFKSAIVDRSTSISSASLVSAYHLHPMAKDIIKRWSNEASESLTPKSNAHSSAASSYLGFGGSSSSSQQQAVQSVQSTSYITQYHALGLLYLIRQGDRMAVTKMIQQLSGGKGGSVASVLRNPMALCMLVRYAGKVMDEDPKYVAYPLIASASEGAPIAHVLVSCSLVSLISLVSQRPAPDVRALRKLPQAQVRHGQHRGRSRHVLHEGCHQPAARTTRPRCVFSRPFFLILPQSALAHFFSCCHFVCAQSFNSSCPRTDRSSSSPPSERSTSSPRRTQPPSPSVTPSSRR